MQDIKPGAKSVHKAPQKSKTLNRQFTKKPVKGINSDVVINKSSRKTNGRALRATNQPKDKSVSRFEKKPLLNKSSVDIKPPKTSAPTTAPVKKTVKSTKKASQNQKSAKSAKEKEIEKVLASATPSQKANKPVKKLNILNKKRFIFYTLLVSATLILIGFMSYFSLPAIALNLANNQAGINARYPEEIPEGFKKTSLAQFKDGNVIIKFVSEDGKYNFTLYQTKTISDSTKLKSTVESLSNDNFATTEYKGLTIYHYSLNNQYITTWVNGDIMYSIKGNANLDPSQIRKTIDGLN